MDAVVVVGIAGLLAAEKVVVEAKEFIERL